MTDQSSNDDLWANTAPQPTTPPADTPEALDPTMVQPAVTAESAPTTVQPTTPGAAEPGGTPPITPPFDPGGGGGEGGRGGGGGGGEGGGGGLPPGGPSSPGGRPDWLGPAAGGLLVGGIIVAIVVILLTRGGDDSVQTVDSSTTSTDTSLPVETTIDPATTLATETTVAADTTIESTTTDAPATTEPPATTAAPETTAAPDTTVEPSGPQIAAPGTVRIDGVEYGIERSCFTQPLAPRNGDLQVFSQLIRIDGRPAIVEQWFDEGGISGGALSIGGFASDTGEMIQLDEGYAIESPAGSGDFGIVANPNSTGDDCGAEQGIQTYDSDNDPRYLRAILDACFVSNDAGESTVVGYGSDLGRVEIEGAGDGTYVMTYRDVEPRLDAAPAEIFGEGGSIAYRAALDGGSVVVYTEDALLRDCTDADLS